MDTSHYLLQDSSPIRVGDIRKGIGEYNEIERGESTIELLPVKYLGCYHQIIVQGIINEELVSKVLVLKRLFNFENKPRYYSLQKLTQAESQRVSSGVLLKPKSKPFKVGDQISFPLGTETKRGKIYKEEGETLVIILLNSTNKIRVSKLKCQGN